MVGDLMNVEQILAHAATLVMLLVMWWKFSARLAVMEMKINTLWRRAEHLIDSGGNE